MKLKIKYQDGETVKVVAHSTEFGVAETGLGFFEAYDEDNAPVFQSHTHNMKYIKVSYE